jgi:hypothetical protein
MASASAASAASASAPELTSGDRLADADVSWMIHGIYIFYLYLESIIIDIYSTLYNYIYIKDIYIYVCVYVYVYVCIVLYSCCMYIF